MQKVWISLALLAICTPAPALAAEDAFEMQRVATNGRTVAAEIADLNGDGRGDLLQVVFVGAPADEERRIRVFLRDHDGHIANEPDFERALPEGSAAYDLADVLPAPGTELVLLRRTGLTLLSLASARGAQRELPLPGPGEITIGAVADDRGLDRLRLAYDEFGAEPWLLVPKLAEAVALSPDGTLRARLEIGAHANFYPPPSGPLIFDNDVQLIFDAPSVSVGDVNGDGHADLLASTRHELRVFLRREDGGFARAPDRVMKLRRVSAQDHVRGSGTVAVAGRDVNGDGRLDLLISVVSGGLIGARSSATIHLNRNGRWNLDRPDHEIPVASGWGGYGLIDLDADGRPELARVSIPFSVLELVEILVTRAIDARVSIYAADESAVYAKEPMLERKLDVPISFETSRPRGFIPTLEFDVNGDGHRDLLDSGGGERINVYLGGKERGYSTRDATQQLDTAGRLRAGDLDGDGLTDLLIFDPRRPDVPVLLGRNLGVLPGTLPRVGSGKSGGR